MLRACTAVLILLSTAPAWAGLEEERCLEDVAATRELAATLPAQDISRRYAENQLDTAIIEMHAGEVDECPDIIARARRIIATRPYQSRPGEPFGFPPR